MVNVQGKEITQDIGLAVTVAQKFKGRLTRFFINVANDLNIDLSNPAKFYPKDKFFVGQPTGASEMMFFVFEAGPKCPPENPCYGWIAMQRRSSAQDMAIVGGIWGTKGGVLEHLIAKQVPSDYKKHSFLSEWDALDKEFQEIVGGWEISEVKAVWVKDHPDSEYVKILGGYQWTSKEGELLLDAAMGNSAERLGLAVGWKYDKGEPLLSNQPFPGLLRSGEEYLCKAKVFVGKKKFLITVNARDPEFHKLQIQKIG